MAQGTLTNLQKLPFTLAPADAQGNPQSVENLKGEALNGADLTFELGADGVSGFVVSGATLGDFQIKLSADAKIGDGEVILEETHDIKVENAQATTLGGTFGAPVPK